MTEAVPRPGSSEDAAAPGLVLVGRFGAPQGVRGAVRVQSFTADPLSVGAYGVLTDAGGSRAFRLASLRPLRKDLLVATVEGVGNRDAAAALTGIALFARRENLPAPDEDEVYVADLLGITATDEAGAPVGIIIAVPNHGAGDMLEISPPDEGETLLVPFTQAFVPTVDTMARRVVVRVPVDEDGADEPA